MTRIRILRAVVAGGTFALLAAAPARAGSIKSPPEARPKGPVVVPPAAIGPEAAKHLTKADDAVTLLVKTADEILAKKNETDPAQILGAWNSNFQAGRDIWAGEFQAALEQAYVHMKRQGKVDEAVIVQLKAQYAATGAFLSRVFGQQGPLVAQWKLEYNQRKATLTFIQKAMPAIAKQLTDDLGRLNQLATEAMEKLHLKETSPTVGDRLMGQLDRLKPALDRIAGVLGARQKAVVPYLDSSTFATLKKKLEAILNTWLTEKDLQAPDLRLPPELLNTLLAWKNTLPKQWEETYNPIWGSAKGAVDWIAEPKRLWAVLPFFKDARSIGDADSLVSQARAAAQERLNALKSRWSILDTIQDAKKRALEARAEVPEERDKRNPDVDRFREVAHQVEILNSTFIGAYSDASYNHIYKDSLDILIAWRNLHEKLADAICSANGHEFDEILAKVARAAPAEVLPLWSTFCTNRSLGIRNARDAIRRKRDDMLAFADRWGKLLPPANK